MSTDPDQIREDIERTRAELSSDVDALTDKVSPTQVAQRQADKVRSAVSDVKDRVMGGAPRRRLGGSRRRHGRGRRVPAAARRQGQGSGQPAGRRAGRVRRGVADLVPAAQHPAGAAAGAVRQGAGRAVGAGGQGRRPGPRRHAA